MDLADEAAWDGDEPDEDAVMVVEDEDVFVYDAEDDEADTDVVPAIVDTNAVIIDADTDETDANAGDATVIDTPDAPKKSLQTPPLQRPRPATSNSAGTRPQGKGGKRGNQR